MSITDMSAREVERLAEDALDAAALCIQDRLGVTSGDFAGQWFASDDGTEIRAILVRYILGELRDARAREGA